MLNRSASLAMSTSVLKALPGKHDIKRHSPSILYLLEGKIQHLSVKAYFSNSVFTSARNLQRCCVESEKFYNLGPMISQMAENAPKRTS